MALTEEELDFVAANTSAAMITNGPNGFPHAVRVGAAVVDGKIWVSGTERRVRTRQLRKDPRATLFVFGGWAYLSLECSVTILEGDDAPALSVTMFRAMQRRPAGPLTWFGKELDEADFQATMAAEGRIIYQFDVQRSYGLLAQPKTQP